MSKGTSRQFERRTLRKRLNRAADPSPKVAYGYGNSVTIADSKDA